MKKYLIIMIILLMASAAFGNASNITRVTDADMRTAVLRADLTLDDLGGATYTSGTQYYVDSVNGQTGRSGKSWALAHNNVDTVIGLIAAAVSAGTEKGKAVINIREGSNFALTGADGVDVDSPGILIRGYGRGTHKPTFDFDAAAAEFVIGAANVRLENLRFRVSYAEVVAGIDIEDAGDGFEIVNCDFGWGETAGTDEFLAAINVKDNVDDGFIGGCTFRAGAAAANYAIHIVSSTTGINIENNHIQGDYAVACIKGSDGDYCENVIITNNVLFNGTMSGDSEIHTQPALEMADNASGFVADNRIISNGGDSAVTIRVADDMVFMNNYITDVDGDEFSGAIESGGASVTATPTG